LDRKTVATRVSKFLQRASDGARTVIVQVDRVDSGPSNLAHLRGGDRGTVHGVDVPLEGRAEFDVELVVERFEVLRGDSAWVFSQSKTKLLHGELTVRAEDWTFSLRKRSDSRWNTPVR
jgi:hypothetical protein